MANERASLPLGPQPVLKIQRNQQGEGEKTVVLAGEFPRLQFEAGITRSLLHSLVPSGYWPPTAIIVQSYLLDFRLREEWVPRAQLTSFSSSHALLCHVVLSQALAE
jgi:hypothetical protein